MPDERIVWGEGPYSARVIILGQNPGPEEMDAQRPFVGGSGRILDRALQRVGLARSRCYITNVVKHYVPPGHPVPPQLVKQDWPLLQKELAALENATTILTLGKESFDSITGKDLKTRHNRKAAEKDPTYWLRGCPYRLEDPGLGRGWWVLPGVHPSFVARTGFIESPLFEVDLDRARRFNEGAVPPSEHFNYNATDQEIIEYVREIIHLGECGVDIETPEAAVDDDELDPMYVTPIELVGLSARVGEAIGVRPDQFHLLKPLLEGCDKTPTNGVVCWTHNGGNFDFYHLGKTFPLRGIKRADCMLGMHLLWPHLTNKDAATCFSIFCDIPYYKNTRKLNPGFYNTVGNCRDTYGALWAGREIVRQMRKFPGMENIFWNSMMAVCDTLNEMRVLGTNTDVNKANQVYVTLMKTLQMYEAWWGKNIPHYSWSSPKQLIELFRAMGMPIFKRKRQKKDDDGNKVTTLSETCDDEALEEYVKRGNKTAALVQTMRSLKHAGDLVSVAREDGRIHPRLKQHGQVGGRIQAVDGNVQTIPEELAGQYPRAIVIPDRPREQVVVVADYSQIELRLYTIQAKATRMLERLNSGDYIYGIFHEEIFKKPFFLEGMPRTKYNKRPDVAPWEILVDKSWPLGFIYGRGVPSNVGLPITPRDCKDIYTRFHRDNPEFGRFHAELEYKATRDGLLVSPYGRIRRFPNPKSMRNEILAFPGQSVAIDVLYRNALVPLPSGLKKYGGRCLFPVHDSVVSQLNIDCVEEGCNYIQTTMQAPIPELGGNFIPVEIKVGHNWGELTSLEKFLAKNRVGAA